LNQRHKDNYKLLWFLFGINRRFISAEKRGGDIGLGHLGKK
jgi:hypothetical protein